MNLLDWAVVAVLVVSGALAFARGFVREALSVAGWVAAAFAAFAAFPTLGPVLREWVGIDWVADVIAAGSVFLLVLVFVSVISGYVADRIHNTEFKTVDRSLGFLFGLARGALLVVLAYMLAAWIFAQDKEPPLMATAKLRPIVAQGAALLESLVPEDMRGDLPDFDNPPPLPNISPGDILNLPSGSGVPAGDGGGESSDTGSGAQPGQPGDTRAGPGYSSEQRDELDRLIEEQTE